ncbi:RE1 [Symbiodinium necroappetens]|uniref:RE1 protein n=1 Tax=Symbiodinium necroappetens TaxID=1628268 RepID=A0A813AS29_9DINO|nr:RE1 [Symbiodinium necroappetens]
MDPDMRKRMGKGSGDDVRSIEERVEPADRREAEPGRDVLRDGVQEATPGQESSRVDDTSEQRVLGDVPGNSAEAIEEANAGLVVNPFWSQRAQDEARLQAARPHHLEEAASDSTEMRLHDEHPMPVGTPVSFGPSASRDPQESESDATPGLRPGERQVLSQMKELMEVLLKQNQELAHQNVGLQQRIDKLEEEKTSSHWRSVGSGGGQDVLNLPYPQGRDPFNPGDRTFWNLPVLEGLHVASPATRAGDWLAQIRPLLFDLSEWSQLWWTRVEWEAQVLYRQWSRAPSIEKGLIQPRVSIELMHVRFRRLESRAYGMLQSAVPQSVIDELLATRMWSRRHARAVSMGVNIPDPALNRLEIDHRPSMTAVIEYMRILQSEWEQVSVSGQEPGTTARPNPGELEEAKGARDHAKDDATIVDRTSIDSRFILVATLGVPLLRDGKPLPLSEEARADDVCDDDGGGIGEWVLEDEAEEGRDEPECAYMSDDEYRKLCDEYDEKWREVAKGLKEDEESRFHIAPVMYREVKDQVKFEAEEIVDETEIQALRDSGAQIEILPAKAKGRERKLQCYAGGADSLSLRPPSVLKQAGFAAEGEFWEITGALYGMQESPADWASYRDETLPTIGIWIQGKKIFLERSAYDNNMWLLRCPETSEILAVLSIYVDDLLLSGTPEASEAVWAAIKEKWRISEPEYADLGRAITFCGFEIRQEEDGIHVGQAKYVQSLLDKYPEIQGMTMCPYAKESENIETKPQPSLPKIRRAQALVGEILWLATRTRADLAYGVSRIGQLITRDCDQAIQRGEDMIRYLRATKNQELLYGCPGKGHGPGDQLPVERSFNLIEVFADASFCPGSDRSQSGIILMWGNAPIGWMSMRQACASLSTAEAELQASLDGMTLAEGIVENSTFEIEGCLVQIDVDAEPDNPTTGIVDIIKLAIRMVRETENDDEWSLVRRTVEGFASSCEIAEPPVPTGDAGAGDNSLDGEGDGAEPLSGGEGDEVEDLGAEFQTALQPKLAEPQNPVIYPGWPLRVPPRFSWDPEPEWGGPESNFHQRMPARLQQDLWYVDRRRGLITRFHVKPRVKLFLPGPSGWPDGISQDRLTGRRRTLAMLHNPEGQQILEDDWSHTSRPTRLLERKWTGRTEFELRSDL